LRSGAGKKNEGVKMEVIPADKGGRLGERLINCYGF
jgi:hypothetical protein